MTKIRYFNRYYTKKIGVLEEGLLKSKYSLTEARVLYELAHQSQKTASFLGDALGLDAGYLSRILKKFEGRKLLTRTPSPEDARRSLLELSPEGRAVFETLDSGSSRAVEEMLNELSELQRERLVASMETIHHILEDSPRQGVIILRPSRTGDLGWVLWQHAELYCREFGWGTPFEKLVAEVVSDYAQRPDERKACWIAERGGERVGSVMVTEDEPSVARLRLLLVDPKARGCGLGRSLVEQCIDYSRNRGFKTLRLWTQSVLLGARSIYGKLGFEKVSQERHSLFGPQLVGETWELKL